VIVLSLAAQAIESLRYPQGLVRTKFDEEQVATMMSPGSDSRRTGKDSLQIGSNLIKPVVSNVLPNAVIDTMSALSRQYRN
jgi:hypothetical protein